MEGRLLLKDCALLRADGRVRTGMAVLVEGSRITRIAPDAELPVRPGDWEVACRGRVVTSGLVDCHAHLVGGQLVPASSEFLLRSPKSRFEQYVSRTGKLTPLEVETLSAHAMARALRNGTTMVVEHLSAPASVFASLEAQASAAKRLGLRLVTSHATHSIGEARELRQLEDNVAFVEKYREHPRVRGMLGFHSSSHSSDELLRSISEARERLNAGVVCHLAESEEDLADTYASYGERVVPRLDEHGLLGPNTIAALARAVDRSEALRLSQTGTFIALTPWLEWVGEPGGGGFEALLTHSNVIGLGTSGTGSLWQQLQAASGRAMQVARAGRLADPDGLVGQMLVSGSAQLCSQLFSAPSGAVEEGALADLVVFDSVPRPADPDGPSAHCWLDLSSTPVAWTIVDGRVVVRERQLLGNDYLELAHEAARVLGTYA